MEQTEEFETLSAASAERYPLPIENVLFNAEACDTAIELHKNHNHIEALGKVLRKDKRELRSQGCLLSTIQLIN